MSVCKYKVGDVLNTPKGKVKLLYKTPGYRDKVTKSWRQPRWIIRVLKTNTVLDVQQGNIIKGKFSYFMERTFHGVGFIGSNIHIETSKQNTVLCRILKLWCNMLSRCYGNYPKYSAWRGCTVDPRWHNFTCFFNTIQKLDGYELWERNDKENRYALDKDSKIPGNTVYSMDTCVFIPVSQNATIRRKEQCISNDNT